MSTEVPKTQDSSGDSDSNSDSENSSNSDSSGSDWECAAVKQNAAHKPHFSVTSCDTGLKLKIAAIPRKVTPKKNTKTSVRKKDDKSNSTPKKKSELSESSSTSESCSKCSSDSSSEDDLPLKTVSKILTKTASQKNNPQNNSNTKTSKSIEQTESEDENLEDVDAKDNKSKQKSNVPKTGNTNAFKTEEATEETTLKKGRGRPKAKFVSAAAESGACGSSSSSSTSSSSASSSSSSSSSSSDSDAPETAAGTPPVPEDSSAALAAACQLQVIDDADLAELFPEQTAAVSTQPSNFTTFSSVHTTSPNNVDKSADNGDGSSSEMELTPQLVTAAIQRATADSSSSENECSNSDAGHPSTTHYASSLLQQFVAQTQLLSSTGTSIAPISSGPSSTLQCTITTPTIEGVGSISDCVLGQVSNIPEIAPIPQSFLNSSQHLSPQQTAELSQINRDLEEITSVTDSVSLSLPEPSCLEDCVDNNDFMNLDISQTSSELGCTDLLKSSPLILTTDDTISQIHSHKLDAISMNSVESQEDIKNTVVESRRKRGRPRKVRNDDLMPVQKKAGNVAGNYHNSTDPPNVSPDSGILSNHNSPTHSPLRRHDAEDSNKINKKSSHKENSTSEKRNMRSKSKSRNMGRTRSDSSDCDYSKKRLDAVKHIKREAPSPVPLKPDQSKHEKSKKLDQKLDIAALDRMLYATDRVLYPPRKKVGRKPQKKAKPAKTPTKTLKDKNQYDSGDTDEEFSASANRSVLTNVYEKRKELNSKLSNLPKKNSKSFSNNPWRENQSENEAVAEDPLDPTWKQIDLNPKYKDILSGYKSDHEFKPYKSCSRLMESGYKSDYGCRSGYKSDYCRSGYKSDHKSGYKTDKSGYKSDYSVRSMRRRMRKYKKTRSVRDQSYYKNQKNFVSDQEIISLSNKTFTCLTLGHSSSESECDYLQKCNASPKYVSVCTKYPFATKYGFGFSKLNSKSTLRANSSDPFAPGPVFSGLQRPHMTHNIFKVNNNNNNTLLKSPSKSVSANGPLPTLKPLFTHKFGASPISTLNKMLCTKKESLSKLLSPKSGRKSSKHSCSKKEAMKPLPSIFEKARNSYVPNKSLSRNVFLSVKKSHIKSSLHVRKHRRTVVLAPPKIQLKPIERPSRLAVKPESRHHRHRSRRRHRSRSASRCRDMKSVETVDQKFSEDMDNLIGSFIKACHIAPKLGSNVAQTQQKPIEKSKNIEESQPAVKTLKRGAKKRKTADSQEVSTPTTKRRHKKQLTESQSKGGKDTNEHKLPLKKRHYHINSSTNNPLSLSLVTSEFGESKSDNSSTKFLCTETNCTGVNKITEESPKSKWAHDKFKKLNDNIKSQSSNQLRTDSHNESFSDESNISKSLRTDEEDLSIKKPSAEQSDLSKKIYETSEKLKAVHKMVHDLEKSLPKSKDSEVKSELAHESLKMSSPRGENKQSVMKNTAPIVTPKKRHRLEANKPHHSSLDQVVQSLSKKLSEDKVVNISNKDVNQNTSIDYKMLEKDSSNSSNSSDSSNNTTDDPLKSMSARSLYKSSIPPAQKSEIMTRKKNRLEGLTSSLVSKINPSAATKVLDTLLNNNIRKSIESRILEKEKGTSESKSNEPKTKEGGSPNTRATVIKSPVSKGKVVETKKSKSDTSSETIVVNIDKPTGIFEPSMDIEDQIPKSSICVNTALEDINKNKTRNKGNDDKKYHPLLTSIDPDSDIPLALISETPDPILRPKRGESIASVLSDKIQETSGGHNLRHSKRNLTNESDETHEKKKKMTTGIIRESKLVLPSNLLIPKIQAERLTLTDTFLKNNDNYKKDSNTTDASKKRPKRRKAINRTGFPSVKKKKKKIGSVVSNVSENNLTSDTDNSAFERVPKDGEAMSTFIERTFNKKPELKVLLNKDDCPRRGRLTVVALEKLQGKELASETHKTTDKNEKKSSSILRAPSLQLKHHKSDKDIKTHVNKWEVLSETDSIPSMTSSLSNDPEDSIPLSLLNVKSGTTTTRLENTERQKRKTRAMSPCQEIEQILSKRKVVDKNFKVALRPKSSLAVLYPGERRLTRSSDCPVDDKNTKNKKEKPEEKKVDHRKPVNDTNNKEQQDTPKCLSIAARRKSRSCQVNKKIRENQSSSRDSSLDILANRKMRSKSPEPPSENMCDHDENDPLPLNEKEIDFEKSIDVLSKTIICKKRVASSRDDSPASSVDNRERPSVSKKNPRLRKKFLVAGLFSEYYKEDTRPEGKAKNLGTQTDFPSGLLAPPPYCERWVRRRLQHFTLPYDIWWQHHYNQPVPSWNYKKIRTNVYYDVKPSAEVCESVACNCDPSSGCNEDCINRLVFCECSPQLCPCGDKCKNQRIQRHEWASGLEKFMTENKGWGVRTKHKIVSGDFILEYVGEVVSDKEFKERMATRYVRDTHHYCLHLDGGLVIDGHRMGGDGRFVNHSCSPNCEMQKWTSNGTFRMALFALRDIDPDEELTYDYNFSLFNPAVGQPCKCDSDDCRGVIGGKSQRVTKLPVKPQSRALSNTSTQSQNGNQPRVGRPRKAVKCNKKSDQQTVTACDIKNMTILKYQQHLNKLWQEPQLKPLTARERNVVKDRHCFLFRNLENVRRIRDRLSSLEQSPPTQPVPVSSPQPAPLPAVASAPVSTIINPLALPNTMNPTVFLNRLQQIRGSKENSARLMVEDNPELPTKERLALVFRVLHKALIDAEDENGKQLCAPLLKLKQAKKDDPVIDLNSILTNIDALSYGNVSQFDSDMNAMFCAVIREHGRVSTLGHIATQLRKIYNSSKADITEQLTKILGPDNPLPSGFLQKTKTEEVILCICGLHVEEGLMVQCGCGVWQHAKCMRVKDTRAPHYCHHCRTPTVDREIPLDEYTEEGHQFYLSLMRGDLQVRQGDTVYVLRDIPIDDKHPDVSQKNGEKTDSPKTKRVDRKKVKNLPKGKDKPEDGQKEGDVRKHTYQTIGEIPVSELDIFRVERLWKHKDTQERYVYGHHYLRPHETFHEPTRKFFPNEVMRVPLYEAVPIELVMSQCWVMDLNTYCKGRPVGASEEHVYICELRVDRTARLFTKVSRPKYPICTKAYAFDHFPQRLKITRTYAPHEVSPEYLKGRGAKSSTADKNKNATTTKETKKKTNALNVPEDSKGVVGRERQKARVNGIAARLLSRGGQRGAVDASYLLAPRRRVAS